MTEINHIAFHIYRRKPGFVAACLLGITCFFATTVFAQVIEEVIVTAQKRTESLQEVPLAITAIGAEEFALQRYCQFRGS